MKIFGGRATRALTQDICSYLGTPPGQADIFKFPNDNTFVQIQENVRNADVFVVQTSVPPVDEALMELLIMVAALRRASARSIAAVLPYYPYVRSDKKDQPRVPVTARLVADLLVTAGVNRVVTVDLTADQIQGFFTIPADHLTAQPVFARYFKEKGLEDRGILSMEEAIHKMTGLPARKLGIRDRGFLRPGFRADLVVFDPALIIDRATYENPWQYPVGVHSVFVNGEPVLCEGEITGRTPGEALRNASTHPSHQAPA